MKNSPADRRSPLGLLPVKPTARPYKRAVEVAHIRDRRFLVMPTGKDFMQVSLKNS